MNFVGYAMCKNGAVVVDIIPSPSTLKFRPFFDTAGITNFKNCVVLLYNFIYRNQFPPSFISTSATLPVGEFRLIFYSAVITIVKD